MNGGDILSIARQQLADAIASAQPGIFEPLNCSEFVAMSALQKAIRRGNEQLALRSAATLLRTSPERLWRRSGCIAFEDIGVADLDTVAVVTAALAGKRFRASLGGEWAVASCIVSKMVKSAKCRAADDLLLAADCHPAYARARLELSSEPTSELLRIATSTAPLGIRAISLWYAVGTWRASPRLQLRRGNPAAVFDALCEAGFPHTVVEIAREGFRKVGEILCPLVALLCPLKMQETAIIEDDLFPPEVMIGDVPSWAYDVYSREGKVALASFLGGCSETARWVRAQIPPRQRVGFLGGILFRVEGGATRSRLRWQTANELRRMVDVEGNGPHCPDATEVLQLLRSDIPVLNRVRAAVVGSGQHV